MIQRQPGEEAWGLETQMFAWRMPGVERQGKEWLANPGGQEWRGCNKNTSLCCKKKYKGFSSGMQECLPSAASPPGSLQEAMNFWYFYKFEVVKWWLVGWLISFQVLFWNNSNCAAIAAFSLGTWTPALWCRKQRCLGSLRIHTLLMHFFGLITHVPPTQPFPQQQLRS